MHKTRDIKFALVVDDFGVKYTNNDADVEHLITALQMVNPETGKPMFEISVDMTGSRFIGLTIDWDYEKREVHLFMPGYVAKALKRFHHQKTTKLQHQPYPHTPVKYGEKVQYAAPVDNSPELDKAGKKFIQVAVEQANPTKQTMQNCNF